ncbi:ATP-dependent helicase, partial [bacterium]|nr:ATP-dependent helicase [bacterium]
MPEQELTPGQRAAVEHGEGPLLVIAGAGTGKTLVITRRIAHLIRSKMARPEEILAVTFTEKAAEEMSERVDVLLPYGFSSVFISTFHALGDRILREYALELGLNPDFQVLSEPEQAIFFREHLFEFPMKQYRPLGDPTRYIQAVLDVISRAKDEDVTARQYLAFAERMKKEATGPDAAALLEEAEKQAEIAGTYAQYQEKMARSGKVDFGDQVSLVLRLFREKPSILARVRKRWRYILADEFQDTNYAQFQLLRFLGGDSANITVVGDDDQSIYKFRGAAISNILGFRQVYPAAKIAVLTENFRSTQVILDTAYRLISHNNPDRLEIREGIDKRLVSAKREGPPVEHFSCDTLTTECDRVAGIIADLVGTGKHAYSDMAILVRSNNSADPFLQALNMREIPWRFTGNRGLYSRPEVKLLLSFLRTVADPDDSVSLYHLAASEIYELKSMADIQACLNLAYRRKRSLYRILCGMDAELSGALSSDGKATMAKVVSDVGHYLERSRTDPTGVLLYRFLVDSNYLKRLTAQPSAENNAKIQNIARFFDVIWSFSQVAKDDKVFHFVGHLDLLIEAGDNPATVEADPGDDAVQVATLHKAKGLEWPVVFLVGLNHNKFPVTRRRDAISLPDDLIRDREVLPSGDSVLQEERRLFYVGMTRAKERLYLTHSADHGGVRKWKISPFVLEALDRPHAGDVEIRSNAQERIRRFAPPPDGRIREIGPMDPDAPLTLSHRQIDDYQTCPLKYKYVHILHVPILPHHTVIYGNAIHQAVEFYHQQKVFGNPVQLEDVLQVFERAWRSEGFLSPEHEERRMEAGRQALGLFFEREQASGIVPRMVEERFGF